MLPNSCGEYQRIHSVKSGSQGAQLASDAVDEESDRVL